MSDLTDSYGVVPHQLEELHNVDTAVREVGDRLTVTDVVDGEPVWGTNPWHRISLSTGSANWAYDDESHPTVTDGHVSLGSEADGRPLNSSTLLGTNGIDLLTSSRPTEIRLVLKTRIGGFDPETQEFPTSSGYIEIGTPSGNLDYQNISWQWRSVDAGYQMAIQSGYPTVFFAVDDPGAWQIVTVQALSLEAATYWQSGSVTVDGNYGVFYNPDDDPASWLRVRFEGYGTDEVEVDLAGTYFEVRAV